MVFGLCKISALPLRSLRLCGATNASPEKPQRRRERKGSAEGFKEDRITQSLLYLETAAHYQ